MTVTVLEPEAPGPPPADARADALVAAAALADRILGRGRPELPGAIDRISEVAVDAVTRVDGRGGSETRDPTSAAAGPRLVEATALSCLGHLVGHPGRSRLPPGLLPGDVFDEDVRGSDALEEELWGDGVPLAELAALLGSERRDPRLTGLLVLAGGLPVAEAADALDRPRDQLEEHLRHLGRRWTDRRRLGLDPEVVVPPPLPDPVEGEDAAGTAAGTVAAPAGLDVGVALARVDERLRRRRRRRNRGLAVAGTAAVLVPLLAVALQREDPRLRVDAQGVRPSTTTTEAPTTVASTTTAVPVANLPPLPTVPVTLPTTTVAPPTTAPPPTAPLANRPMQATLEVLTPTVEAGRTASARVSWIDADLADADVRIVDVWGDPEVAYVFTAEGRPPCDAPGPGGGGSRDLRFRYATPGTYTVSVVVTSCDGNGAYGERRALTGRVEVTPPVVGGTAGRTVVAAGDTAALVAERAVATFTPDGGSAVTLEARDPALPLNALGMSNTGPPTVLRLPDGVRGELRLTDGATCRRGTVDLTTATPAVPRVVLAQPC